jgi:hypothetical protein
MVVAFAACSDAAAPKLGPVIDSTVHVPAPTRVKEVPVPQLIHDTFIRDGILFVCAWNTGLIIYDVGNGIKGGSPSNPIEISRIVTATNGLTGAFVHNAWWFYNPVSNEKKYVFVGQEGPATIPSRTTGDIHVVDVSDLTQPKEVAYYHMHFSATDSAGTHNFWMDEPGQILYAAYYNGGVVALNVSGNLSGDLSTHEIARYTPASTNFMWGVQLANGSLYAVDMLNGLYQLKFSGGAFTTTSGGGNVPERYSSDLWINGQYAYTGTWGGIARVTGVSANAVKIWRLNATGGPTLADSIIITGIQTVSDVKGTDDGKTLVVSAEGGTRPGLYLFRLTDPARPTLVAWDSLGRGVHTVKVSQIAGKRYVFGARDGSSTDTPALIIYDISPFSP